MYRADEDEIDSDEIDSASEGDAYEAEELKHVDEGIYYKATWNN